jgi:hypothetical protein
MAAALPRGTRRKVSGSALGWGPFNAEPAAGLVLPDLGRDNNKNAQTA